MFCFEKASNFNLAGHTTIIPWKCSTTSVKRRVTTPSSQRCCKKWFGLWEMCFYIWFNLPHRVVQLTPRWGKLNQCQWVCLTWVYRKTIHCKNPIPGQNNHSKIELYNHAKHICQLFTTSHTGAKNWKLIQLATVSPIDI